MPKSTGIPTAAEIAAHAEKYGDSDGDGRWISTNGVLRFVGDLSTFDFDEEWAPYRPVNEYEEEVLWPEVDEDGEDAGVATSKPAGEPLVWRCPKSDQPPRDRNVIRVCRNPETGAVYTTTGVSADFVYAWCEFPDWRLPRIAELEAELAALRVEVSDAG